MVGDWIEKFPEAVKKIYESGNEIANHSESHPHVNNLSYEKNQEGLNELKLNIGNYKMYLSNNGVIGGKIINGEREIKDIYEIKVLNPNEINETQKWIEHILFQLTLTKEDVTQIIGKILKVI
jgi:peptidoglycan/xylan/chitin deacetylase (PgdA/CDA1 family)